MSTVRKVVVDELKVGMYVSELDRPWLETPFLFQGFFIRDQEELQEVKKHCEHVFVMEDEEPAELASPVRSSEPPRETQPEPTFTKRVTGDSDSKRKFSWRSLFQFRSPPDNNEALLRSRKPGIVYEQQVTLKEEIPAAKNIHAKAVAAVQSVMDNLHNSGTLDVDRVEETVDPMVESVLRNPSALACLVRMQKVNNYLYNHSIATSIWATILGRQIGLQREDINVVAMGAILLDVGMTKLPPEMLQKPHALDRAELGLVRKHVHFGLEIIDRAGVVDHRVAEMVAHHHERHNGTGYPYGLKGTEIPVFGRIAGIVDTYDAMTTSRPYAQLQSSYEALRHLQQLADVEFQAEIVEQFTKAVGVFPTGTLVELNTGEIGVVTKQNRIRRLRPEVMIVMSSGKLLLDEFRLVDLNQETVSSKTQNSLWIERGLAPGEHGIDPTEFYLD